jgi:hypothetical protein
LAIGAYRESSAGRGVNPPASDSVASSSGAAYVFTRAAGGTWAQQAFIKASNAEANDLFGFALALSGDTLAAGAEGESSRATGVNPAADLQSDNSARNSGAVYIFQRQGVSWAQQAYVKASNTGAGDVFGSSVALSGDTLAVGAPAEDSSGITVNPPQGDDAAANSGAVYVFTRSATADWSQQAFLKPFNTDNDDHFGTVALTGDVLAVGAPGEPSSFHERVMTDTGAPDSGAVYVFGRPDGVSGAWATRFYLKAVNLDAGDQFGFPLAVDGDTLAVGAAREASRATGVNSTGLYDNGALESGAVYIFR